MEIVVKGRNVAVPEHYRVHVADKMGHVERYDGKVVRYDVELFHERNPRQAKTCQRVEITGIGHGPAVRAEARGPDFYAALDAAVDKLEARLRRSADRRKVHHGRRQPTSVAAATAAPDPTLVADGPTLRDTPAGQAPTASEDDVPDQRWDPPEPDGPGQIVRRKEHSSTPMSVDQALYEMELVGHDFYLFADAESGLPSVVYRRRGFDYGVIALV